MTKIGNQSITHHGHNTLKQLKYRSKALRKSQLYTLLSHRINRDWFQNPPGHQEAGQNAIK